MLLQFETEGVEMYFAFTDAVVHSCICTSYLSMPCCNCFFFLSKHICDLKKIRCLNEFQVLCSKREKYIEILLPLKVA